MNTNTKLILSLAASVGLAALVGCGGGAATSETGSVMQAIRADADFALFVDYRAIDTSPFSKEYEAANPDQVQDIEDFGPVGVKIKEITGLSENDIAEFAISVTNIGALAEGDFAQGHLVAGIRFLKPLTAQQVVDAVKAVAADEGRDVTLSIEERDGASFIDLPEDTQPSPDLWAAIITGSSEAMGFIGDKASVEGAVKSSGEAPEALVAVGKSLLPKSNAWVSFVLPQDMKDMLKAQVDSGQMPFPGAQAIAGLQNVGFAAASADDFKLSIGAEFAQDSEAIAIHSLIDTFLLAMVKQQAAQLFGGTTPGFVSGLNASVSGKKVSLNSALTSADLTLLQEMSAGMMPLPGAAPAPIE